MNIDAKERIVKVVDKAAFFLFIALVFFLPISNAAIESIIGFIALCFIGRCFLKKPTLLAAKDFFKVRVNLAVLIFYIGIGLSILTYNYSFSISLKAWLTKWGEAVALFYIAQVFLKKKHIKALLGVFLFSALLLCIDGFYQWMFNVDFIRGFKLIEMRDYFAVSATFKHYNNYATFLVVLFFISFGFISYFKNSIPSIAVSLLALLIFINLILTYSRGAWISFGTASLFLVLFFSSMDRRTGIISIFLLLLSFIAVIIMVPSAKERLIFTVQKGGDSDRFRIWKAAFMMFKESPLLGKGLGSFTGLIRNYDYGIWSQYAHNCYFQILAETGIAGIVPFFWFLWELTSAVYKKIHRKKDLLFLGLFSGFLGFLVHSFFDTQLFSIKTATLFWILASFLTIYIRENSEPGLEPGA